jgi:cyclic pyranopterin phosphate synthase
MFDATDFKTPVAMWLMLAGAAIRKRWKPCPISSVAIEVNQHCNRRCGYCPVSADPKPSKYIRRDLFDDIIRQLEEMQYDGKIKYHFYNEPLLHRGLETLIAHATLRLPRAKSVIYTNGDALTEARARSLFSAGVRQFIVTDHGGRSPTSFVRSASQRPHFRWSKVHVRSFNSQSFLFSRGGVMPLPRIRQFDYCSFPAYEAVIDIEGNLLMCCNDFDRAHSFGNVLQKPLIEIWESDAMTRLREDLLRGVFTAPMCRSCAVGSAGLVQISRPSRP